MRAGVEPPDDAPHRRLHLLDDGVAVPTAHDPLHGDRLVARHEQEGRRLVAHLLVLVERRDDPVAAADVRALADELRLAGLEPLRRRSDPLVDVTVERLGLCHLRNRFSHLASRRTPLSSNDGAAPTVAASVAEMEWPESVERVASVLRASAVETRIEEFRGGTPTAEAAAAAVGCDLGQIVKSLVFDCDGRFVVALVPGDRRADAARVAAAVGAAKARVGSAEQVEQATGFVPGAVAPFPLPLVEAVLAERQLLGHDVVWFGAGSPQHMAALAPEDLVRIARARTLDLVTHA